MPPTLNPALLTLSNLDSDVVTISPCLEMIFTVLLSLDDMYHVAVMTRGGQGHGAEACITNHGAK